MDTMLVRFETSMLIYVSCSTLLFLYQLTTSEWKPSPKDEKTSARPLSVLTRNERKQENKRNNNGRSSDSDNGSDSSSDGESTSTSESGDEKEYISDSSTDTNEETGG